MTHTRTTTLIRVVFLALVTTVASVGLLRAEDSAGNFTLPFEVRWGKAVLPPGDYSLKIDKTNYIVTIRGENRAAMVLSPIPTTNTDARTSALVIVHYGNRATVRALRLAEQGLVFHFPAPKAERELLARAPELLQRIPVVMSGM